MSEWLDLMLEEITRKRREAREAEAENRHRAGEDDNESKDSANQSK